MEYNSNSILSECGGPCEGGPFGHVGKGKGDHFVVGVVDFVVDEEVEAYSVLLKTHLIWVSYLVAYISTTLFWSLSTVVYFSDYTIVFYRL